MVDVHLENLNKFLIDYFEMFHLDSCRGIDFSSPGFEFCAYDFLRFAEEELDKNTDENLINCISNLKRAMDCQLDTFLYTFNLFNVINKKNLKFETKLEFLNECGVFNSRSLVRLNTIRNKVEHEYKKPKIEDIEVYYDLVVSFISVLEQTILLLNMHGEMNFIFYEEYSPSGSFKIKYNIEKPSIIVEYEVDKNGQVDGEVEEDNIEICIDDYKKFAYLFRVFLLLYQSCAIYNKNHILLCLQKSIPQ